MGKCKISHITDGPSKVGRLTKYGFGTGHISNDIASSLYFAYALLYYTNVVQLGPVYCGIILLVNQFADGIGTVVFGILIDKKAPFRVCTIYGKRKVDNV